MVILCEQCSSSGLPILPVRYTVMPTRITPSLPGWAGGNQVTSVPLAGDYHYALRTLRSGYVYLFYAKNARGSNQWECFSVGEDGCLTKQPSLTMVRPQATPAFQCSRLGHTHTNVHYLVIDKPEQCGTTWIAFSEHKWSNETINEYTTNGQLRDARMQTLHPAQMINGAKHSHGNPVDAASLQGILEYSAALNPAYLPSSGVPMKLSQEDGSYTRSELEQRSTRYPWHLRNVGNQVDDTVKSMHTRAVKKDGSPGTPHLLAVWDAIGITHELNGYRNDAAGRVDQYGKERALQIGASNKISGLEQALVDRNLGQVRKAQEATKQIRARGYDPNLVQTRRARVATAPDSPEKRAELRHCELMDYIGQQGIWYAYEFDLGRIQFEVSITKRMALYDQFKARVDANRAEWVKDEANDQAQAERYARETQWPKYRARLEADGQLAEKFKRRYDELFKQADALIDRRTQALVNWLEAPLLIATLEDFHPTNISDGILFEDAVGTAMLGMGSTKVGMDKLDAWVKELSAIAKSNLLWRAIALNQQQGIAALDAALKEADQHRTAQTLSSAVTWAGYTAKVLKGLADTYKKAQGILDGNTKAASEAGLFAFGARVNAVNMRGFDATVITAGDRVFRYFAIDKLGDYASEKIIQHVFSIRAFVDPLDSERLVQAQAVAEKLSRAETLRRLHATQAFMSLDTPEIRTAQTDELKQAWSKFKVSGDSKVGQAVKDTRLALVVGLIEGVNFAKLMADCKAKGDKKSYFSLLASGMTITSAMFDVAATAAKNLPHLGSESWTYQALKGWGGVLGGGASFVGGIVDLMEAGNSDKKGYSGLYYLYAIKSFSGFVSGGLTFAVAFTYAAPLVSRLTGRAAVGATINTAGKRAAAVIGFRILGMAAGGWITAGMLGVQVIIWVVTPDALEDWLDHSAFGSKRTSDGYKTAQEQEEKLSQALVEMGFQ